MDRFSFFGQEIPGVDPQELKGKLIVIEGADGVGRSTQIRLLKQWLETKGHAVLATRMIRSVLAGKGLRKAKKGTTLGRVTMALFYATDFADRNQIVNTSTQIKDLVGLQGESVDLANPIRIGRTYWEAETGARWRREAAYPASWRRGGGSLGHIDAGPR